MACGTSDFSSKALDNTTSLDSLTLRTVCNELGEVEHKAYKIGIQLGIPRGKMVQFKQEGDILSAAVDYWLSRNISDVPITWESLVEILKSDYVGEVGCAKKIMGKYCQHDRNSLILIIDSLLSVLSSKLQLLMDMSSNKDSEDSTFILMKDVIKQFIVKSFQSKADRKEIEQCLTKVYTELLFSNRIYEWALEEIASVPEVSSDGSPDEPKEEEDDTRPLFCEDTVYHASLCCCAIGTKDALSYKKFFTDSKHLFEELSFSHSREDVDRYIIARKGKTYFIAFQSEPFLLEWLKHYDSIEHGIQVQTSRIPLRFLIQQLHDGHQIVCIGHSFGGLLALSVTASLWKQDLIGTSILEKNLCCICLSPPIINLPILQEVSMEMPQIKPTLHSIIVRDDFIPRLAIFLDPKNEDICSEAILNSKEFTQLTSIKNFQGLFTSNLFYQIGNLQKVIMLKGHNSSDESIDTESLLSSAKLLMLKTWPHLVKAIDSNTLLGYIHIIDLDSAKGLVWNTVTNGKALEISSLKDNEIESLTIHSLFKNDTLSYHEKIVKSFVRDPPETICTLLPDLKDVKPIVKSVSFHRYGKEFAITVTGENLWFCNKVKVGPLKQSINAGDSSQKLLQFYRNVKDITSISSTSDHINVKAWSHFSGPVSNDKAVVKRKVYRFSFRQEQLAKLTPSELIKTGYLSALLEQLPHSAISQSKGFSRRFEAICNFLSRVVSVVPIESLMHAIAVANDLEIALQCCRQLMKVSSTSLPSSTTMESSLNRAINQMYSDICNDTSEKRNPIIHHTKSTKEARENAKQLHLEEPLLINRQERRQYVKTKRYMYARPAKPGEMYTVINFDLMDMNMPEFNWLLKLRPTIANGSGADAICGINLNDAYPFNVNDSKGPLQSPLQILRDGRKKMQWLVQSSIKDSSEQSQNPQKLTQLYNSKMLEIVNEIRRNEVEVCSLLLGAFMEEQIRVPLMKTSFDTARAIEVATSAAAVGIWALYTLTLGDVQAIIDAIPSRSLLIEVKDYIKGVFKQDTLTADENYAGKLQFMIQGMNETVSCNSHYVSYSLERQLIELCKTLKINTTPLETLISNWDEIFRDNVMFLVVPQYRSLIARWLKWALMVHHLREELARYTAVGVVGLVNSGKSLLVSTLFNIEIPVGTTAMKRTTVPFLYNMDGVVDGLDVIDFPGVDDRDETISDLAELLLAIAQVVVFVVDYRKAHTESAKKWLELLEEKSVPVLVCLTYADKLYAECMGRDGSHPEPLKIKQRLAQEREMMLEQLGHDPSRTVRFFSFSQDRDSTLNSENGRGRLRGAGIGTPQDVGDWLAEVFEQQLDQDELAEKLRALVHRAPTDHDNEV